MASVVLLRVVAAAVARVGMWVAATDATMGRSRAVARAGEGAVAGSQQVAPAAAASGQLSVQIGWRSDERGFMAQQVLLGIGPQPCSRGLTRWQTGQQMRVLVSLGRFLQRRRFVRV